MKRMVKNGDLIDVEPDGSITAGGKTINAIEANPTVDATETLEKVKIGDVTYNVGGGGGGGGGSEYTAGNNIEISETKEISVKNALSGIKEVNFVKYNSGANESCNIKGASGALQIQTSYSFSNYPEIDIMRRGSATGIGKLFFAFEGGHDTIVNVSATGLTASNFYVFLTRDGKVPEVPRDAGTYILKATVQSNGAVTYSWVAE